MPVSSAFHLEAAAPQAKRHLHVVRPCPREETVQRVLRALSTSGALAVRGRLVDVASRAHLLENLHEQVV